MDVSIKSSNKDGFTVSVDSIPAANKNYRVKAVVTLEDGSTLSATKDLLLKVIQYDTMTVTAPDTIVPADGTKSCTVAYSNSEGLTPNVSVTALEVTSNNSALTVSNVTTSGFSITGSAVSAITTVTLTLKATLSNGNTFSTTKTVTLKNPCTSVAINGDDSFVAKNGSGSADYTFAFTPSNHTSAVSLTSVTSNNSSIVVSNATTSGFTLGVSGITADVSGTITTILSVDGVTKTLTKSVSITYQKIVEYVAVDLGLPSGRLWANMNVGATSETDYGEYFQWGDTVGYGSDTSDGKVFDWSSYKYGTGSSALTKYNNNSSRGTVDNLTTLEAEDDAAAVNMGGSWRMPDKADFDELLNTDYCTNEWTTVNGVYGRLFTSVANGNTLFFPAAGCRYSSSVNGAGGYGRVWSRSLCTDGPNSAWYLLFHSGAAYTNSYYRYNGYSVRGVQ